MVPTAEALAAACSRSGDPMVLLSADRRVLWSNEAARDLFGPAPAGAFCGDWLRCQTADGFPLPTHGSCLGLRCLRAGTLPHERMRVASAGGETLEVAASYARVGQDTLFLVLKDLRPYLQADAALQAEKLRLARDLHDGPAQILASAQVTAAMLQRRLDAGDLPGAVALGEHVRTLIAHAVQETRLTLAALSRPSHRPVDEAIAQALADFAAGPPVRYVNRAGPLEADAATCRQIELFVREAVSNAVRHAQASSIQVRLSRRGRYVLLAVVDDGIGIDPERAAQGGHYGLLFLKERAERLGARLRIARRPQGGTEVSLRLPDDLVRTAHAAPA